MRIARCIAFVIAGLLAAASYLPAQEADRDAAPLTPREFHEQELARIRRGLEAQRLQPIASTQADFDVVYYDLTVDVRNYSGRIIYGAVTILARSLANDLNEMILDLCSSFTIDSALSAGIARPYTLTNNLLTISLDRTYTQGQLVTVRVVYRGTPCQSSTFTSFSYYTRSVGGQNIPSIATLSEPYGARDWWPSKNVPDDKADSVRVSIIVADTLTATSNGVLESVTSLPNNARRFTWVERYPISTYLVCISATNYAHFSDFYVSQSGDTMPIEHYSYPERLQAARVSWSGLPVMISYLASLFGEYPFVTEKYGHTMFNFGGAMEHQCNTSYGYGITTGDHTYDWIMLHELAHQWWGNDVTLATWPDIWLNEGFASYCEALWAEHLGGFEALREWQTNTSRNGVTDPSGPVYNPTQLFDGNTVYSKGSWILHILRGVIRNDSLFFAGLNEYRSRHHYGNATTVEFLDAMSDAVGYDVAPYVHTYLYRTNRPRFRVSYGTGVVDGAWQTVVRIRQTQTNPDTTFRTRLDLRFVASGDTVWRRVENWDWRQRYYFRLGINPTALAVDPHDWVLRIVQFETLPLTILNDTLASGTVGVPYVDTLVTLGGATGARTWTIIGGALAPNLTLSTAGVISGTPSQSGTFRARIRVQDSGTGADTLWLGQVILAPLAPPANVTVYRLDEDQVRLCWRTAAAADSYYVYRATVADMSDATRIAATTDTVYSDAIPPDAGAVRFYRVTTFRRQ